MDDVALRLLVAGGIGLAAMTWAMVLRNGRSLRRRPFQSPDLEPGLHLFSSESCDSCARARSALAEAGVPFVEHTFESNSAALEANTIDRVPTIVWVSGSDDPGWRAEGVPSKRALSRWLGP